MRYWWVNQNQTHRQEFGGGYLWSPKRSQGDRRNPFYEFMREVAPGDLIFSFFDTRIFAIGVATSNCYECPKPPEFGAVGTNWEQIGWKVQVNFVEMDTKIRPKDHMQLLRKVLPARYSPLQGSGNGNQGVYLTEVPIVLAETLFGLIGRQALDLARTVASQPTFPRPTGEKADMEVWEHHLEQTIEESSEIPQTERQALIVARRGQGLFKERVMRIERFCRVTRVEREPCPPTRQSLQALERCKERGAAQWRERAVVDPYY